MKRLLCARTCTQPSEGLFLRTWACVSKHVCACVHVCARTNLNVSEHMSMRVSKS